MFVVVGSKPTYQSVYLCDGVEKIIIYELKIIIKFQNTIEVIKFALIEFLPDSKDKQKFNNPNLALIP